MKELQIIMKPEDDGNPLNQEKGREPAEGRTTVGWKLFDNAGEVYGAYISLPSPANKDEIKQAINILVDQAYATDLMLSVGGVEG